MLHVRVVFLFGGILSTIEELKQHIQEFLLGQPPLEGITRVQAAAFDLNDPDAGLLVILRTDHGLSRHIGQCGPQEYSLPMFEHLKVCLQALSSHLTAQEVIPSCNELLLLALYEAGGTSMESLGFKLDDKQQRIISPKVALGEMRDLIDSSRDKKFQRSLKAMPAWGNALLMADWYESSDEPHSTPAVQIVHVPEAPHIDDLAPTQIEQALCLSAGWGLVSLYTPEIWQANSEILRAGIDRETLIQY